jgi:hypothetical protein
MGCNSVLEGDGIVAEIAKVFRARRAECKRVLRGVEGFAVGV